MSLPEHVFYFIALDKEEIVKANELELSSYNSTHSLTIPSYQHHIILLTTSIILKLIVIIG